MKENINYREYDPDTLKRLQDAELSILKDFIWLCEKYDCTWFSFAGTAIGALRHQGFIPWDDDIDVCLPRKDYDRLLAAVEREFPDKYLVMNAPHNENYPLTTSRIMLRGTRFREYALKDIDCELGIFLDVYPFDYVPKEESAYRRQAIRAWFWSKILILCCVPDPVIMGQGFKVQAAKRICWAAHYVFKGIHLSKAWVYQKCLRAMTCCKENTGRLAYLCDTSPFWNTIEEEDLFPLRKEPFEDVMVNFPNHIEKMLEKMWPDFMTLPPVEKRKNHYPYELDFGDKG